MKPIPPETIAEVCQRVPRLGARTFHEALQSLFFAQIAINLESLTPGAFQPEDETLLMILASQLAVGIEKTRQTYRQGHAGIVRQDLFHLDLVLPRIAEIVFVAEGLAGAADQG